MIYSIVGEDESEEVPWQGVTTMIVDSLHGSKSVEDDLFSVSEASNEHRKTRAQGI